MNVLAIQPLLLVLQKTTRRAKSPLSGASLVQKAKLLVYQRPFPLHLILFKGEALMSDECLCRGREG